jgi:5-oxoprolinase (ATP-hydrolysing)
LTPGRWRIRVDTGGTFTDCVAIDPEGRPHRAKVLSSSALRFRVREADGHGLRLAHEEPPGPDLLRGGRCRWLGATDRPERAVVAFDRVTGELTLDGDPGEPPPGERPAVEIRFDEEAPVLAARRVTGTPRGRPLPPLDLRLATTRATNALLERRGARVALFVTRGFADLLTIGTQQRPDLFALDIRRPQPLYEAVVEVDERLAADGTAVRALPETPPPALAARARELLADGVAHAAVALLHSYLQPAHERRVARWLRELGFAEVVTSSELAPSIRVLPRAETAVVEAYVGPVLSTYLRRVEEAVAVSGEGAEASTLRVMTSAGGLVPVRRFRAKDGLLSGPAGGVVGAARAARASGFERVLTFDMGGTSTDVARVDGDFEYRFEHAVGDAHLLAPALALETVAAGGGSLCGFDGRRLTVGPESAGASPGPACYGAGGPLTLTDVNLLLGRLDPDRFEIPLNRPAAEAAFGDVAGRAGAAPGDERRDLLAGFVAIADLRMAEAIRALSVRRGYDPRRYALVAFGGAGAQHACAVAELLGCETVLVPEDAGLLSARGLGAAVVEAFAERQVLAPLGSLAGGEGLATLWRDLEAEARDQLVDEGPAPADVAPRRRLAHLRLAGQDAALAVEAAPGESGGDAAALARHFETAYRRRYGYFPDGREIEVVSLRVVVSTREAEGAERKEEPVEAGEPATVPSRPADPVTTRSLVGIEGDVPCFERAALASGDGASGPALVFERHSATFVAPGWRFHRDGAGALVLERKR